jgi:uroporphyrinogen III methyltransferase/synthase
VKAFCARNGELDFSLVPAVCIGPQTAKTASESGMRTMVAEKAEMDELVRLVVRLAEESEIPPVK